MINLLNEWTNFDLTLWQWALICLTGASIGFSKTGISGVITVFVPVMAIIFGARESTGVVVPMLCFADLLAALYYRRSADFACILRLMPWAIAGLAAALLVDHLVPVRAFKFLIGICILGGIVVMLWNEFQLRKTAGKKTNDDEKNSHGIGNVPVIRVLKQAFFGVAGGFSTMIGNAAGPVMSVYLLSMRLPKLSFVGTTAWFFLIINYLKIPLQVFAWNNINVNGLKLGVLMIPFIIIGAILGIYLVKKISEVFYRYLVLGMTLATTFLLFL
jgi:uncharacterized membrane protein YfcA